jgi:hypothetical protein
METKKAEVFRMNEVLAFIDPWTKQITVLSPEEAPVNRPFRPGDKIQVDANGKLR